MQGLSAFSCPSFSCQLGLENRFSEGPAWPRGFFGIQAADLLLRRAEKRGEFFLGQASTLAKGHDLQGDIPSFTGLLETGCKRWILKLFLVKSMLSQHHF
jgi:hypothetical protein